MQFRDLGISEICFSWTPTDDDLLLLREGDTVLIRLTPIFEECGTTVGYLIHPRGKPTPERGRHPKVRPRGIPCLTLVKLGASSNARTLH